MKSPSPCGQRGDANWACIIIITRNISGPTFHPIGCKNFWPWRRRRWWWVCNCSPNVASNRYMWYDVYRYMWYWSGRAKGLASHRYSKTNFHFSWKGFCHILYFYLANSLPRKVKVGLRVAMASQPLESKLKTLFNYNAFSAEKKGIFFIWPKKLVGW